MPHETHHKIASHFHQALAKSIDQAVDFPIGMLVTLVHAEITGNAKFAKGVISVLPESAEQTALTYLKDADADIKSALNKNIRLRQLPILHWAIDRTEIEAAKIEETLHELEERGEL